MQQQQVPIHQQILAMTTSPYGDNPIFKDLKPASGLSEDALRPTNPAAQKAILESSSSNQFKVTPNTGNSLKIKPIQSSLSKVNEKTILATRQSDFHRQFLISEIAVRRPGRI